MPTRIAFCITELDSGGAEWALVRLATGLDRTDWQPAVFCLQDRGPLAEPLETANIPVTCFGLKHAWQAPRVARNLQRELQKFRPALLQTWLFHANLIGRFSARWAGVPRVVAGIRVADRRSAWRLWADRWTAGMVDRHVCVSQGVERFSEEQGRLPASSLITIPNGVDVARFANAVPADLSEFGFPADSPLALFVGRMDPQKQPLQFVAMAARIAASDPAARFLMVGDGPLFESVGKAVADSGLENRLRLTGHRNDVPRLMRAAHCLVLTSRWEGMPNVILEAMAAGLPVVATDVEGIRELVVDGVHGRVIPSDDVESLISAVQQVFHHPQEARRRSMNAQKHVEEHFTWNSIIHKYACLYRELVYPQHPIDPCLQPRHRPE